MVGLWRIRIIIPWDMARECVGTVESYPDPDRCEEEDGDGCVSAIDARWKLHCQSGV